jgi:RNase H.
MATYYCDASTYNNGRPGQDSSFLVLFPDGTEFRKHLGNCSINAAELAAITYAAHRASPGDLITTDSQICYNWVAGPRFKRTKANAYLSGEIMFVRGLVEGKKVSVKWLGRDENLAGKRIEEKPFYADWRALREVELQDQHIQEIIRYE